MTRWYVYSFHFFMEPLTVLKRIGKHAGVLPCAYIHIQLYTYFLLNVRTELKERELWVRASEGLHPWRYSEVIWTWFWTIGCRWPCLTRGVWTKWPTEVPSYLSYSVTVIVWILQLGKITIKQRNKQKIKNKWNSQQPNQNPLNPILLKYEVKFKFCFLLSSIICSEALRRINMTYRKSLSLHSSTWKVLWQYLS